MTTCLLNIGVIQDAWSLRRRFFVSSLEQIQEVILFPWDEETGSHFTCIDMAINSAFILYQGDVARKLSEKMHFYHSYNGKKKRAVIKTLSWLPSMKTKVSELEKYRQDMLTLKKDSEIAIDEFRKTLLNITKLPETPMTTRLLHPNTQIHFLSMGSLLHQGAMLIETDIIERMSCRFQQLSAGSKKPDKPELVLNYTTKKGRNVFFHHNYKMLDDEVFYGDRNLRAFLSIDSAIKAAKLIAPSAICQWIDINGDTRKFSLQDDIGYVMDSAPIKSQHGAAHLPQFTEDDVIQ